MPSRRGKVVEGSAEAVSGAQVSQSLEPLVIGELPNIIYMRGSTNTKTNTNEM
jgi:hypothetical protein